MPWAGGTTTFAAWTAAPGLPRHVVRYEDLLDKPAKVMRGLLDFLSVKPDSAKLARRSRPPPSRR